MVKPKRDRAKLIVESIDMVAMLKRYSEKVAVHAERNRLVRMLSEARLRGLL